MTCVLILLKNSENNGTEEIGLVTPTPGVAAAIYLENKVIDMAADGLAHCVTMPSADMILTV